MIQKKTEAPYSFRRRLLTSKGEDLYIKNYEKYSLDLYKSWKKVDEILTKLDRLSTESYNESYINLRESLEKSVKYYEEDYLDFVIFLERQRTENSLQQLENLKTTHQGHDIRIHATFTKLRFKLEQHDWKTKQSSCDDDLLLYDDDNTNFTSTTTFKKSSSKHSDKFSSKSGTGLSSRSSLSEKRKKADIAKAKLKNSEIEMQIKKEQSLLALELAKSQKRTEDLEADLELLNIKKEVAVTEAEVRSAEGEKM